MSNKYTFVVLKSGSNLIGIVPEMPGVVAEANNNKDLNNRIKEAISVYIQTLQQEKLHLPPKLDLVEIGEVEVDNE